MLAERWTSGTKFSGFFGGLWESFHKEVEGKWIGVILGENETNETVHKKAP